MALQAASAHSTYAALKAAHQPPPTFAANSAADQLGPLSIGGSQSAYVALKSGIDGGGGPAHLIRPNATGFSPYFSGSAAAAAAAATSGDSLLGSPVPEYNRTSAEQQQQQPARAAYVDYQQQQSLVAHHSISQASGVRTIDLSFNQDYPFFKLIFMSSQHNHFSPPLKMIHISQSIILPSSTTRRPDGTGHPL